MLQVRGIEAVLKMLESRSAGIRELALSEVLIHVQPSDVQKARALVRLGRNVFAQDDVLSGRIVALILEKLRAASGGSSGGVISLRGVTSIWGDVGRFVVEVVKKRLRDEEPTPGGKTALTDEYARRKFEKWGAKPIGIASEELINGVDFVIQRR